MGERKVINKYYPPDFDPSRIPKKKKPKNDQIKVRMMLPMSICCNTCGEYLYKGKKFNSRKETVIGEEYLGVKIFRFYVKCTRCSSELTVKTDPKNSDYVCEMGASRNFEPWRENQKIIDEAKHQRQKEEEGDAMKALENRTVDSKTEMDILDALDELRSLNARHSQVETNDLLKHSKRTFDQSLLDEEDEKLIRSTVFYNSNKFIRHIDDLDEEEISNKNLNKNANDLIPNVHTRAQNPPKKRKDHAIVVQAIPKKDNLINSKTSVVAKSSLFLVDY